MKLTQSRIESLIDTLNDLICDERSLTREQRENMVRTVAILGGLGERQRLIAAEDEALRQATDANARSYTHEEVMQAMQERIDRARDKPC
ncbi:MULTISPECIES: hypothetical protein [Enterobacterales]|uniref:Uncharacterized protein n=1 Tax=Escherichia coli TaxID=562 RepID=A0A7G9AA48_ECOLX|nr:MULTISPECIES: hypothetical protein [Enterobacterales]EKX8779418.1 hypothetical protein [Citrobacter freundii]HCB1599306.1 hypothetical protein [Citrobacter farmeri]HCT2233467.1 hypothetical protein [Enterobacter hormaechei]EFM0215893.1 hypothetical protein [Escherichia coli]EKZ9974894.1 hypothetical protein [Klebsiella pneumoniae]